MDKIKSLADLKKKREELQANMSLRENSDSPEPVVRDRKSTRLNSSH